MEYTKKFLYQSNQWYNDGLKKANIRDLSGAILSLKKSLQFNRGNIAARNLLGLVYYGRGETVEALVEWIISKNMKSHENIAEYYIKKVQDTQSELEVINQAIKKYNQCLLYCQQDGEDLAVIQLKKVITSHPTFLKAHQLLALLYLKTEQYAKARQVLRKAHKLDTTNDITLRYMHELTQLHNKNRLKKNEPKEQSVTYNLGNETIIQPVSSNLKDTSATITIVNIVIGIVMGAAIVWFLINPAVQQSAASKTNKDIVAYSDQIAEKESEISAMKKEVEEYRAQMEAVEAEKKKAEGTQAGYETLVAAMNHYYQRNYNTETLTEELFAITTESLGPVAKEQYDEMVGAVFPKQCDKLYKAARRSNNGANYPAAIEDLEKIMRMDESYNDGNALYLLGDSYEGNGETEKAKEKYNRVVELFPDSVPARKAEKALEELNAVPPVQ